MVVAPVCLILAANIPAMQGQSPAILMGTASSSEEGTMQGVLVSAKRAGSTITITVVTDARGRYSFPSDRLEPGTYAIRTRAIGYDLVDPGIAAVAPGKSTELNLTLRKTKDLASQLSNGEWFMSWPENTTIKNGLLNCTQCHSLQPIVESKFTKEQWIPIINRMARYAQGSTRTRPQLRPGSGTGNPLLQQSMVGREGEPPVQSELVAATADYLASVNLSAGLTWSYPLKTLPRPTGNATRVIITEYDLPRPEALPHDAVADADGNIWYSDFGTHVLGVLDPNTGKATEHRIPITKPGAPEGSLDVVLDKRGDVWIGTMYQGSLVRFDRKSKEFQTWSSPAYRERDNARIAMVMPINGDVDGQVWIGGDNEYQVDIRTGAWKPVDYSIGLPANLRASLRELSSYGVASDSKNNLYGMNLNGTFIIKVDAKSKTVTPFATPTPNAGPRRGHMDAQDRLWFAEFRGNKIAMFDTKTERFQEWPVPTPWTSVYDAVADSAGFAWSGGMNNDLVVRINTKTGVIVEYLLPRLTNIRRVNVDNRTSPPTFWIGNNLGAALIKVEPIDR